MKKRIGIIIILIIGVFTVYQYAIQKYYEYMINRDFNLNIKGGNIELISREEEWLDNGDGEKLLVFKINNLYLENVNNINTTQHGIYASPEWTGQPYPSLGWQNIRQDQEPPEGWPRPPKFNEPGDVPGPPVQYGDPITPQTVKAGYGFIDNGIIEKNLYFYHPDPTWEVLHILRIEREE